MIFDLLTRKSFSLFRPDLKVQNKRKIIPGKRKITAAIFERIYKNKSLLFESTENQELLARIILPGGIRIYNDNFFIILFLANNLTEPFYNVIPGGGGGDKGIYPVFSAFDPKGHLQPQAIPLAKKILVLSLSLTNRKESQIHFGKQMY